MIFEFMPVVTLNAILVGIFALIIKMMLVGGAVIIGIFILAVVVGSVRELIKIFNGDLGDNKGKK